MMTESPLPKLNAVEVVTGDQDTLSTEANTVNGSFSNRRMVTASMVAHLGCRQMG